MTTKRNRNTGCRFIADEPFWTKLGDAIFCNAKRKPGSSYCCEHHAVVWFAAPPRVKKAA